MITIQRKLKFAKGRSDRKVHRRETAPPVARVPRVARLMALAIRFDQMLRDGEVADYAELARIGHVSRARVTQVMNLLALAPDIQEEVLFLPATERGRAKTTERHLRSLAAMADWRQQRQLWANLVPPIGVTISTSCAGSTSEIVR